ncbi:MAG TPA: hydantoinase/oxoprolinase family protein [Solirubrobacteraceae bacterium]|nr:hydantoinase/oxoprolinase family protein [Solirubrobacteraceae bacterium]
MRLGIDIGGTFTDLTLANGDGAVTRWKVPSTPPDFGAGVINGIDLVASDMGMDRRSLLASLEELAHGTTVTTNLILTRTGERVGILTTRGFADLYELARQYRGHEQDPAKVSHPVPLVPRADVEEVFERTDFRGRELLPLDRIGLKYSIRALLAKGIRSFAVCFLWSFRDPSHELAARQEILDICPEAFVALSHEACPLIGEYERLSTTVITAYAGPALRRYASALESELRDYGFDGTLLLMKSDGGLGSVDGAVQAAGQTIYSGPVAGVIGARAMARDLGEPNLITFDMGGTSTDVGLVHEGRLGKTALQFLDRQALAIPMIDVTTVGAGGGSVGWRGPEGSLRVGPQSTGADPGPACYGRNGELATVTDANLVLGLIDPEFFLGGGMRLDRDAAEHALGALADELGLSIQELAIGMFRVANSVMADAIRLRTVFAGLDPRSFTLVSFGGAGGLHAACIAEELGVERVLVPSLASVFSAAGLITTDVVYTFVRSASDTVEAGDGLSPERLTELNKAFRELDAEAQNALDVLNVPADRRELIHEVGLSYRRQILDFDVEVPAGVLAPGDVAKAVRAFDDRYASIYGVGAAAPENGYDLKGFRVTGIGRLRRAFAGGTDEVVASSAQPVGARTALPGPDVDELEELDLYRGDQLPPGASLAGPAIVEYADTTLLVPRGWGATVDGYNNLLLTRS